MKYYFELEGEDHTQFMWECEADSKKDAIDKLEIIYPEATMRDCISHDAYLDRETARYDRLKAEMDDDYDYSGDNWL